MTVTVNYEPFDQEHWIGEPPWHEGNPAVKAWEAAHGHDVRLKCYVEYGCQVIEPTLERKVEALTAELQQVRSAWQVQTAEWADIRRGLVVERDAALKLVDDTVETLEWLSTCNPDTNNVNAIASTTLRAVKPGRDV